MLKKASWFLCLLILAISCLDEPDCFRLNNNFAGIAFKKMYDGEADTVALIGVQASGTDSVFSQFVLTTRAYLQLNYFTDQTAFVIESLEGVRQVVLGYDVKTQFVSEDCGARYVLSNLELLSATYDSIRIIDATPGASQQGANIEVYRCPITNRMEFSFRQYQNGTSVPLALKINSITDVGTGNVSYIDTTLQTVYLPLNPGENVNQYTVNLAGESSPKNLNIAYVRSPRKFFDICGDQQLFHDLEVTSAGFDFLQVVNDSIQDPPVTNVIAYRCPQTNLMQVYFRKNGSPIRNDTIDVKKITDEDGNILYQNQKLTFVILPLDSDSNSAEFTFELQTTTKTLVVSYETSVATLFDACGEQTLFSGITVAPAPLTTFTQAAVRLDSVQFPARTNVEIIQ